MTEEKKPHPDHPVKKPQTQDSPPPLPPPGPPQVPDPVGP